MEDAYDRDSLRRLGRDMLTLSGAATAREAALTLAVSLQATDVHRQLAENGAAFAHS